MTCNSTSRSARSCKLQMARPSGGLLQASATSVASPFASSLGAAPGRGWSYSARARRSPDGASAKRRRHAQHGGLARVQGRRDVGVEQVVGRGEEDVRAAHGAGRGGPPADEHRRGGTPAPARAAPGGRSAGRTAHERHRIGASRARPPWPAACTTSSGRGHPQALKEKCNCSIQPRVIQARCRSHVTGPVGPPEHRYSAVTTPYMVVPRGVGGVRPDVHGRR